jgi:hypothetical protein
MHVDEIVRAGRLMQRVDILGDGEDLALMLALKPGQRLMRRVRPRVVVPSAAEIVELKHAGRIAGEAFRRRHLLQRKLRPQPAFVAEGAEPAFGREPRAGENDDALVFRHHCHAREGGHQVTTDLRSCWQ